MVRRFVLLCSLPLILAADTHWILFRSGPFTVYSDAGDKTARLALDQLEQFRYAAGQMLGKPDLQFVWPVRVIVFRAGELNASSTKLDFSRDCQVAAFREKEPLSDEFKRSLARHLLDENTRKLPDAEENGLLALLSTLDIDVNRITVGRPPAERTRDWARLQMLATDENTAGELHIFLSNLEQGGSVEAASHNAFRIPASELEKRVDAYMATGNYRTRTWSGSTINPERDFHFEHLDPDEVKMLTADYQLSIGSPKAADGYRELHGPDADEGLGLAALAAGNKADAQKHFADAIGQGAKGARAWYEAGLLETAVDKKRTDLAKAAELNPKWADPFLRLAETEPGPVRRTFWLKKAAEASPRDIALWKELAKSATDAEQYSDAARAWAMAEAAAGNEADRKAIEDERMQAEQARMDAEDAERKRKQDEQQADIERVRQAHLDAIHAAEAQANAKLNPDGKFSGEGAVKWSDLEQSGPFVIGLFERFDCIGAQGRMVIKTDQGRTVRLLVADASQVSVGGADAKIACGEQQPVHKVHVNYTRKLSQKTGTSGEVTAIEYRDAQ